MPGVHLLESGDERLILEIDLADYSLDKRLVDGKAYDVVYIPGWGLTEDAGAPQLPMGRVLLGIPAGAEIWLEVLENAVQESGSYRIIPAPETVLRTDPRDQLGPWITPPDYEKLYAESPTTYGADALYPAAVARVGEVGFIRNQRVAAIELYPIQYNPVSQRIRFHSRLRIEVSFSYPAGRPRPQQSVPENPIFEQLFQNQLLNYMTARQWRSGSAISLAMAGWQPPAEAYKITIGRDGIYQLTYNDLESAQVPVHTLDPRTIQIFSQGQEVAIRVVGEEDGSFDSDDHVLLFAQTSGDKYADWSVYWLTYGQTVGLRMPKRDEEQTGPRASPSVFTTHMRIEEEKRYVPQWPGDDSTDRWYREFAIAQIDVTATVTATADLGKVSNEVMSSTLWISMKGHNDFPFLDPDHHAVFYVNGFRVGEHWWDGKHTAELVQVDFPQSYLTPGTNTFRTSFPGDTGGDYEYVLFDRYELSYGHAHRAESNQLWFNQATSGEWEFQISGFTRPDVEVYDVSVPMTVTLIANPTVVPVTATYTLRFSDTVSDTSMYLALTPDRWLSPESIVPDSPSDLHNAVNGADYIVISHADFLAAAQTLADYRGAQGMRAFVVDVEDVYDEFGWGLPRPHAIRDFLRYAFEHWQPPAPAYVVLLGDGTYDPKNNLDQGVISYVPPYLAFVDPWLGETAADNRFASIIGSDILPDLFVGRLPANSLAEANAMVDKIMSYEQSMEGAGWNDQLTFVAGKQPDPKGAGNFHDLSEGVIGDHIPQFYDVSRVYHGSIPGATCASGPVCRQQLVDAINAGTLLVNYIGHGSVIQWDAYILSREAIDQLTNADRFPIMLPMTCLDGYFIHALPDYPSLSELVVRSVAKGAVASWGPTGLGIVSGHDQLNRGFLDAVISNGMRELGQATYAGKLRLYGVGHSREQIEEYTLFGDPATRIHSLEVVDVQVGQSLEGPEEIVPGTVLTFTLTYTNAGPDIASGVVLTDLIPGLLISPTVVYSSPDIISQQDGVTFVWTVADLLPGTGGEVRIRVVVSQAGEPPVAFINTAEISSAVADLDPSNNRARIAVGTVRTYLPAIHKTP